MTFMDNDKKPQFTKEFLSPSLFRIDSLVTQGKLTAADFPLKTYKLRANYLDMHVEAIVVIADSWFLSDRTNAELVMQRYDRSLGALGDRNGCLLMSHGVLCCGTDLEQAYLACKASEQAAGEQLGLE